MSKKLETSKDTIIATNSVVHQIFDDVEDVGETVDKAHLTLEKLAKEFYNFKRTHLKMQKDLEYVIAKEVEKQLRPMNKKLDQILLLKPKAIYIMPSLPNPISWLFRLIPIGKKKGGK